MVVAAGTTSELCLTDYDGVAPLLSSRGIRLKDCISDEHI